jgi:hypothetical protein
MMPPLQFTYFIGIVIIVTFTFLAFWRVGKDNGGSQSSAILFQLTAGASIIAGLYSPDALSQLGYSTFGVSFGLILIAYSFACVGLAYASIFKMK